MFFSKVRSGRITSMLEDYGVVDNEFYFSTTEIPVRAFRPIRENDQVRDQLLGFQFCGGLSGPQDHSKPYFMA